LTFSRPKYYPLKEFTIVIFLSMIYGCASTAHIERGDDLLAELAVAVADKYPEDKYLKSIAKRTGKHAEEKAGFSPASLLSLLDPIGGVPGLLMILTGTGALGLGGRKILKSKQSG